MNISETYLFLGVYNYMVTYFEPDFLLMKIEDVKLITDEVKMLLEDSSEYDFEIIEDFEDEKINFSKFLNVNDIYMSLYDSEKMNEYISKIEPEEIEISSEILSNIMDELDDELKIIVDSNNMNTIKQIKELEDYYYYLQQLYIISVKNESLGNDNKKLMALSKLNIDKRNKLLKDICIDGYVCSYIKNIDSKTGNQTIDIDEENSYIIRLKEDVDLVQNYYNLIRLKENDYNKHFETGKYYVERNEEIFIRNYKSVSKLLKSDGLKKLKYQSSYLKHKMIYDNLIMETIYFNRGKYKSFFNSKFSNEKKDNILFNVEQEELDSIKESLEFFKTLTNHIIVKSPNLYSFILYELITIKSITNVSEKANKLVNEFIENNLKNSMNHSIIYNLIVNINDIEKGCEKVYKKVKHSKNRIIYNFEK